MATPKPSATNCPRLRACVYFLVRFHLFSFSVALLVPVFAGRYPTAYVPLLGDTVQFTVTMVYACQTYSGGYSSGVPPLPIPNREVKPGRADGTAHKVGE